MAVPHSLPLVFFVLYYYQQFSLIDATLTIKTSVDHQYENQTIHCNSTEPCVVICQNLYACKHSTIYCPAEHSCDITCNSSWSCEESTIHAKDSSFFQLLDCATGTWTCVGITIYFPTNSGTPLSKLIGADIGLSAGIEAKSPLQFYAVDGWNDVDITTHDTFTHIDEIHVGTMHCLKDYSVACNFSLTAWSCANPDDFCNDPYTLNPSKAPTLPSMNPSKRPTHQPFIRLHAGSPSLHETTSQTKAREGEIAYHSTIFTTFQNNEHSARITPDDYFATLIPFLAVSLLVFALIIAVVVCWFRKRIEATDAINNLDSVVQEPEKEANADIDENECNPGAPHQKAENECRANKEGDAQRMFSVCDDHDDDEKEANVDKSAGVDGNACNHETVAAEHRTNKGDGQILSVYDGEGTDEEDEELYDTNVEIETMGNNTTQMGDAQHATNSGSFEVTDAGSDAANVQAAEEVATTKGVALNE